MLRKCLFGVMAPCHSQSLSQPLLLTQVLGGPQGQLSEVPTRPPACLPRSLGGSRFKSTLTPQAPCCRPSLSLLLKLSPPGPFSPLGLCTCCSPCLGHPSPLLLGHFFFLSLVLVRALRINNETRAGPFGTLQTGTGRQPLMASSPWAAECAEWTSPTSARTPGCTITSPGCRCRARARARIQTPCSAPVPCLHRRMSVFTPQAAHVCTCTCKRAQAHAYQRGAV